MERRPHHRTYYRGPGSRGLRWSALSVGVVVLIVGASAVAASAAFIIGGFALAPPQSAASVTPSAPAGVSYWSVYALFASLLNPSATAKCNATDSSTPTAPDGPLAGGATVFVCLNNVPTTGYNANDVVEQATVNWTSVVPTNTTYELAISLSEGSGSLTTKAYVKTPATALASTAFVMVTFDMTAAAVTSVTGITVIVSDCGLSGSGCP